MFLNTREFRPYILLLLRAMALAIGPFFQLSAQTPIIKTFTIEHGLPQNAVFDIKQDRLGFLWVCTMGGVTRFDGTEFLTPSHMDLTSQRVWCVSETRNGDLWFGTKSGVVRMSRSAGSARFVTFDATHGVGYAVRSVLESFDGRIWLFGDGGVGYLDSSAGWAYVDQSKLFELPDRSFLCAVEDNRKSIWAASVRGVFKLDSAGTKAKRVFGDDHGPIVRGLLLDGADLWISTQDGQLHRFDLVRHESERILLPEKVRSCYGMVKTRNGDFWIGTASGAMKFQGRPGPSTPVRFIDTRSGLSNDIILPVVQDHQDNLWFGTHDGLALLSKSAGQRLIVDENVGLVTQTMMDASGKLWICASSGVYVWDVKKNRLLKRLGQDDNVGSKTVVAFGHRVVLGSERRLQFFRIDGPLPELEHTLEANGVSSLAVIGDHLLVGGRDHLRVIEGLGSGQYREVRRLDAPSVYSINPSPDDLWVGTNDGLFKVHGFPDSIELRRFPDVADVRTAIGHVYQAADSSLWVATEGRGLFIADGKHVRRYDVSTGLSDNIVNAICPVSDRQVWVTTNRGLSVYDIRDRRLLGSYSAELLTGKNGNVFWASVEGDRVYLSTSNGVVVMPREFEAHDSIPVHIEGLIVNGEPVGEGYLFVEKEITLPSVSSEVEFTLIANTMVGGRQVRFQYRLVGFDDKWSRPLTDRRVRYTGLNPGSYQIEVRALHADGSTAGSVNKMITILTPFWQTGWFVGLAGTSFVLVLYAGHRWRLRLLEKRAKELSRVVEERTEEVRRQSEVLALQKSDLETALKSLQETQSRLIHAEKMSSLGRMVAGIAHEINNPLTFIHGNIPLLRKEYARLSHLLSAEIQEASAASDILDACERGTVRISDIVKRLKSFSRLDQADFAGLDICSGLDHAVDMVVYQFPNMVVYRDYSARPTLMVSARELQQAFYNIILNAAESYENSDPRVWINVNQAKDGVRIAIADRGRGISGEIASKIFDPFFTTKPIGKGTGLGLTLAYNVMSSHRGTVTFETNPDGGTIMQLFLPDSPNSPT